jgi:hypothetical protein
MEGAGSGRGSERGGAPTMDPSNLGDFLQDLINEFERNRMPVDSEVIDYIRNVVLVGEKEWEDGVRNGRIDVSQTRTILLEALEATGQLADRVGHPLVDMTLAEPTFVQVMERRNCPYPIMIC